MSAPACPALLRRASVSGPRWGPVRLLGVGLGLGAVAACGATKPGPDSGGGGTGGGAGAGGAAVDSGDAGWSGEDGATGIVQGGRWTVEVVAVDVDDCGVVDELGASEAAVSAVSATGWDLALGLPEGAATLRCAWDGTHWSAGPADDTLPGGTVRTLELAGDRASATALSGRLFVAAACPDGDCTDRTPAGCRSVLALSLAAAP